MTETLTAAGFAAAASAFTLALLGVDYYALLWAFIGALAALWQARQMSRTAAVIHVFLSTLLGAAFGSGAASIVGDGHRFVLIVLSLVGGAGAQALLGAAIARAAGFIATFGAQK